MKTNDLFSGITRVAQGLRKGSARPAREWLKSMTILALLLIISIGNAWGAAATLPVNYSFTGGKSSLPTGVTQSGLGSDYAAGNSPYLLKFDGNGDYIQIQVDAAAETITIGVKEFGTSGASIQIQGSSDGSSFTNIQTLSFSQGQNKTSSQSTSNSISSSYRYFRVKRNSGSNFGLGTLAITKAAASKTLSSIAITTQPTKRAYLVGQTFSKTGAVVRATYSDATTADVSSSATWTPTTGLVSGSNTITASYTEGGVTKTATTTVTGYSVTIQVKDVDGNTLSGAGAPTASPSGASITASASGNNYVFKRWVAVTAAGTSFADANNRSTTLSGTPTGDVTIKAEYYKPINITWNAGGSAYTPGTPGTAQVGYGALMSSLTLPSPAPSTGTYCGDKFVGWTTQANVSQDDDTGLNLFTSVAGNSTAITEDKDFYAVFADYDD